MALEWKYDIRFYLRHLDIHYPTSSRTLNTAKTLYQSGLEGRRSPPSVSHVYIPPPMTLSREPKPVARWTPYSLYPSSMHLQALFCSALRLAYIPCLVLWMDPKVLMYYH